MRLQFLRTAPRPLVWLTAAAVVLVGALAVLFIGLRIVQAATPGILAGVHVEGEEVAGLDRAELAGRVDDLAAQRRAEPVTVESAHDERTGTREDAGLRTDEDAAVEQVWSVGRTGLFRALSDHIAARTGRVVEVDIPTSVDEGRAEAWAAETAEALSVEPQPADVTFDPAANPNPDDLVVVTEPAPGEVVDADALADELIDHVDAEDPVELSAPGETTAPPADQDDLDAVLPDARTAVSGAVTLTNPSAGEDLELDPSMLAAALRVTLDEDAPAGQRLRLDATPDDVEEAVGEERIAAVTAEPVEATITVEGGSVNISGGTSGFQFDAAALAEQLPEVALSDERSAELAGETTEPDLTREEAEDLEIVEEVSSFTTHHACCQTRVDNIQLMADMIDGVLVKPGESFSINDHTGPRTAEAGFGPGGVIIDGEIEQGIGGGVSQFATTFFNAVFFAGVQIDEFQPHSFYISRYPEGREATLAYGVLDVAFTNDSPYGILIKTSYTPTSITVSFWSRQWAEVEAGSSGRQNVQPGEVTNGFDITITRTITYPDGTTSREEYFHRYQPRDAD